MIAPLFCLAYPEAMRGSIVALLGVAIQFATPGSTSVAAHEPDVAVEIRLGGQKAEVGGFWPSLGFFGAIRLWRQLSVGAGYDYFRVYPGELCSGDVCEGPIVGASLMTGCWWTLARGSWFGRAGALAGISGPGLHPHEDHGGTALELAADTQVGWSGRRARVFLFGTPRYTRGTLGNHPNEADLDAFSVHYGVGAAALF